MPIEPPGVPTPYTVHVHPYPTRFHGGIWTRPVFGLPYVRNVQNVMRGSQLSAPVAGLGNADGLGCGCSGKGQAGLGLVYDTHSGVFRRPRSGGGGIFNSTISGLGEEAAAPMSQTLKVALAFGGAAVVAGVATALFLSKKKGKKG